MRISRLSWRLLPVWTLFLGMLIGGLEGGLTSAENWGALGIYVLITGVPWVTIELVARRREMKQVSEPK